MLHAILLLAVSCMIVEPEDSFLRNVQDYADIMMHLIKLWKIEGLTGLTPEAEAAQDWLCKQPPRIRRLAERDLARTNKPTVNAPFSWVFNREINLIPSKY